MVSFLSKKKNYIYTYKEYLEYLDDISRDLYAPSISFDKWMEARIKWERLQKKTKEINKRSRTKWQKKNKHKIRIKNLRKATDIKKKKFLW